MILPMEKLTELLTTAQARGLELGTSYSGSLLPKEAYEILSLAEGAKLIDVRTRAELVWVGRIPAAIEIEWMSYPGTQPNADFVELLKNQVDPSAIVMFICRIGTRSHKAATLAFRAGFTKCYNVLEGFEGDIDPLSNQRGKINGWRHANLPWKS